MNDLGCEDVLNFIRSFVFLPLWIVFGNLFSNQDVEHMLLIMTMHFKYVLLIKFVYKCAEFSWDEVKADKHRENYLGHSIKAPVGRWQKGYFFLYLLFCFLIYMKLFTYSC